MDTQIRKIRKKDLKKIKVVFGNPIYGSDKENDSEFIDTVYREIKNFESVSKGD